MQNIVDKTAIPFKNGVIFVAVYFIALLPTYYLPYVGSNSSLINALGAAMGATLSPQFWAHIAALFILIVATWLRGCAVGKQWLIIFPIIAAVFDITPGLSIIPLIPTFIHVVALIMGARGSTTEDPATKVPVIGAILACAVGAVIASGLMHSWTWRSRLHQSIAAADLKPTAGRPEAPTLSAPPSPSRDTENIQQGDSRRLPVQDWIGQWEDGGPGCASLSNGQSARHLIFRAWYCEADPKLSTPLVLEHDASVDEYVHELTGLTIKLLPNGKIRTSALGEVRNRLGEGAYLAEEVQEFERK